MQSDFSGKQTEERQGVSETGRFLEKECQQCAAERRKAFSCYTQSWWCLLLLELRPSFCMWQAHAGALMSPVASRYKTRKARKTLHSFLRRQSLKPCCYVPVYASQLRTDCLNRLQATGLVSRLVIVPSKNSCNLQQKEARRKPLPAAQETTRCSHVSIPTNHGILVFIESVPP